VRVIVVGRVGVPRMLVRVVRRAAVQPSRVVPVVGARPRPVGMVVLVRVSMRMHVCVRMRVAGRAVPVPVLVIVPVLVLVGVRVSVRVSVRVVVAVRAVVAVCHGNS
jgi:hypothetical protein